MSTDADEVLRDFAAGRRRRWLPDRLAVRAARLAVRGKDPLNAYRGNPAVRFWRTCTLQEKAMAGAMALLGLIMIVIGVQALP
ncbi:hypothetical protein ACFZBU_43675 [Embleya sp. NPDC008237]|uniref:hypothetical protein n=1 Tax=Embleya sp. NPDC008237 TaxID=3363978 RepID=UPI0036E84687